MRYAVMGAGALGVLYGGRLQRAGHEVHFLGRGDAEHVRRHGLRVRSPDGEFHLPEVHFYTDPRAMPRCPVVLVTLKTTQNHLLPNLLPPTLEPDGMVILLQNGLGMEDEVAAAVGADRVMGGLAFVCCYKVGPGHVHHLDYGAVAFAEYTPDGSPGGVTPRMEQVGRDFQAAGIPVHLLGDLIAARWRKLVWNIPFNGLSVLRRATTDQIMKDPNSRALAEALMREVVSGARANRRHIPDEFVDQMMRDTDRMVPYRTSMLIDYEAGRPMEVEAIFGNPLRAARAAGAECPRIAELYAALKAL
jgi:2-dehydropantoate 2-reductase